MLAVACAGILVVRASLGHHESPRAVPPPPLASASPPLDAAAPAEIAVPQIHGHVLDADGNAVEGAAVRLVSASPPFTVYAETRSDRAGAFSFQRVGPWRVRVVGEHAPDGVVTSALLRTTEGRTTEITLVLSTAGSVRGAVADAKGQPVPGAVVSVEGVPWIVPPATSDDAGTFRLTTVPDEATSLVAVARGFKTAHAELSPRADQTERFVRFTLTGAENVRGDVRDEAGNPIRARVVACEDQPAETRTLSAEDGSFELPASAIGCAALAEHAEYAPSDPVEVAPDRRLALRLKAGGSIAGTAVNERGESVPSFTLGIESFAPTRGWTFDHGGARTFDDAHGTFRWDKLAPGTYSLTASAEGRPPARSEPIEVRPGIETRGVRFVLPRGGTLTGTVTDERNAPLAGADVRFDQVSSAVPSDVSAQTDARGGYRLEGAPVGPVSVLVRKDGFRMKIVAGIRVEPATTRRLDVALTALDGGTQLELGGIGAALARSDPGIVLGDVFPETPAARAGLRRGDLILRVDGEKADGMSIADVLQRLRGEPGSSVGVSVLRPATGENVDLTIVRGRIVR